MARERGESGENRAGNKGNSPAKRQKKTADPVKGRRLNLAKLLALARNVRLKLRTAVDDAGVQSFFDQLARLGKVGGSVGIERYALGFLGNVDALGQAT
mgnify:CR=1 FL=1